MLKEGPANLSKKLFRLTIAGGLAFWAVSIATSLLPVAAEYRAAHSDWSIQTVWIASLPMGLIIGFCVSYVLLRYFDTIPSKNPMLKSIILSFIVLIIGGLGSTTGALIGGIILPGILVLLLTFWPYWDKTSAAGAGIWWARERKPASISGRSSTETPWRRSGSTSATHWPKVQR